MSNEQVLNLVGLARKAGFVTVGTDSILKSLAKIHLIFLANDASIKTKERIMKKSFYYQIPVIDIFHSEAISKAVGKSAIMLIAITDSGFTKRILELTISKEEVITNEG